jgi:non-homologous end joining protein Ku
MTSKLDVSTFHDEYREHLEEMIERRKQGKTVEVADEFEDRAPPKTVNLMDALRRSLKSAGPAHHDAHSNSRGNGHVTPRKRIARARRPAHARKR